MKHLNTVAVTLTLTLHQACPAKQPLLGFRAADFVPFHTPTRLLPSVETLNNFRSSRGTDKFVVAEAAISLVFCHSVLHDAYSTTSHVLHICNGGSSAETDPFLTDIPL